jgi:hypothetical protein
VSLHSGNVALRDLLQAFLHPFGSRGPKRLELFDLGLRGSLVSTEDMAPYGVLQTLQARSISVEEEVVVSQLYDALPRDLKILNIYCTLACYRYIARFSGLRALHLDFSPWEAPIVLETVARIPGVAILQLQSINTRAETREILALLPQTVQRLSLQWVRDADVAMMELLADTSFLPRLCHLNIVINGRPHVKLVSGLEPLLATRAIRFTQTTDFYQPWVGDGLPVGME